MPEKTFIPLLQFVDFKLTWLPTLPTRVERIKVRPTRLGVFSAAALQPAVAPLSWMPTLRRFLAIPRLHRTYSVFHSDPLSGAALAIGQAQGWAPTLSRPVARPHLLTKGGEVYLVPPSIVAAAVPCVDLVETSFSLPTLITPTLAFSTLIAETFTRPDMVQEEFC